jgi:hypothetical protein
LWPRMACCSKPSSLSIRELTHTSLLITTRRRWRSPKWKKCNRSGVT